MRGSRLLLLLLLLLSAISLPAADADFKPLKTEVFHGGAAGRKIVVDVTGQNDLYLTATVGGDSYDSDQAIWGNPTLFDAAGNAVDLSKIAPKKSSVGWGKLFVNQNHTGAPLAIGTEKLAGGFWAHAPSMLQFSLGGKYTRFEAYVGIDSKASQVGSAVFIVDNTVPAPALLSFGKPMQSTEPVAMAKSASESPHTFNPEAAKILLDHGIDKLLFVRRFTLNANHVYSEYVNSRWTPGGGPAVLDLKTGTATDLVPETATGVVNRLDLSFDAKTVLFGWKKSQGEGYRIFEADVTGGGIRQLTFPEEDEADLHQLYGGRGYHNGTDDLHPCYLPDGGIVFSSTRIQHGVLCAAGDQFTAKVLHRMNADGSNMQRLSNNSVSEASPAVLPDGRIIYHRWEYNGKGAGAVKCLWAMNPDGTASSEVYGNQITDPETMIYPRPIPGTTDKIVFLGTTHCCPNNAMGTVIVLDTSREITSTAAMRFVTQDVDARSHNGFHFKVGDQWVYDPSGSKGRLFKDPYPISEKLFIVAHKPIGIPWDSPAGYGLYLLDADGKETLLYKDEAISCWLPYPLVPRVRPPVLSTVTDPVLAADNFARCMVTDVYQGMTDVPRGTIKYLRIMEQTGRPWSSRNRWKGDSLGMAHTVIGYGLLAMKAQYGIVPVESDGSAYFKVPANRNIYFQALDKNYMAVQTERTYVNYMPGETRGCIGCHQSPKGAPPAGSYSMLALRREPSTPAAQPGDSSAQIVFDYERHIQPIWDRQCLNCHGADHPKGGLRLTGEPTALFNTSYEALMGLTDKSGRMGDSKLLGRYSTEDDIRNDVQGVPPYAFGAHTSLLAAVLGNFDPIPSAFDGKVLDRLPALRAAHAEVKLSQAEFIRIVNWLDASCQYHPSYWGMKNAQYKAAAHFRPPVTFAEAISPRPPASLKDLYPTGAAQ